MTHNVGERPDDPEWQKMFLFNQFQSIFEEARDALASSNLDGLEGVTSARKIEGWAARVLEVYGQRVELSTDDRVRVMFEDWVKVRAALPQSVGRLLGLAALFNPGESHGKGKTE